MNCPLFQGLHALQKKQKVILSLSLAILAIAIFIHRPDLWFPVTFVLGEPSSDTPFVISSTIDDRPILYFKASVIDYRCNPLYAISFDEITVSQPQEGKMVWALIHEGKATNLTTLTYGVCPPNYKETLTPQPLIIGHYYRVNSEVIKKVAPSKYEVMSFSEFRKLKGGSSGDQRK